MEGCVGHLTCECGELSGRAKDQIQAFKYRIKSIEEIIPVFESGGMNQKIRDANKTLEYNRKHLKIWVKEDI